MVTLALPHLTATDDEYRGYHIPKGSVVIPACTFFSPRKEDSLIGS